MRRHDYAGGGAYFVTICTHGKKSLFGEIVEGEMILNETGRAVRKVWDALPDRFDLLVLDAFQIMPNHMHAVFVLPGPGLKLELASATGAPIVQPRPKCVGAGLALPEGTGALPKGTASRPPTDLNLMGGRTGASLGDIVGAFKSICTITINRLRSAPGMRLLQQNFYERIIRDTRELEAIRDYIVHNPQRWLEDPENPERM